MKEFLFYERKPESMNRTIVLLLAMLFCSLNVGVCDMTCPLGGMPRHRLVYNIERSEPLPDSVVKTLRVSFGSVEEQEGKPVQWLCLQGTKSNEERFTVWLLAECYPSASLAAARETTARYIVQEGDNQAIEFRDKFTGKAVLPSLGAWKYLFPRTAEGEFISDTLPKHVQYLGHSYVLVGGVTTGNVPPPQDPRVLELLPDLLIGVPHNTRQKDETRRYDESDYELIRLTQDDYMEMIDAGMTCFNVDLEQSDWIKDLNVFYWGIGGKHVKYPECLYRSNYLGPTLFLDEPAVHVRDYVIRPRIEKERDFAKSLTPQLMFQEFEKLFCHENEQGAPRSFIQALAAREDVDLGNMEFLQNNLYTWETMIATGVYQLSDKPGGPPSSIVFEPPGRFGTLQVLPLMNMSYGCQIPTDNPKNFIDIIYGFLRGAARETGKGWGTSIYGAVDRSDTFWFLTHAYDLGAQKFFFWDSYQMACVPYGECLALTRNLHAHVESHPDRNLDRLLRSGEIAILLPPGYNLGHVHIGRGNLWGLPELNLERKTRYGVQYRTVMGNFFTEIERCIRLGISYDLLWDLEGLQLTDYREIVRVREDGKVEVLAGGKTALLDGARTPARPDGTSPTLAVTLSQEGTRAPVQIGARAELTEGSSPVYYTLGTNKQGIYENFRVCWELFGPEEQDCRYLLQTVPHPVIQETADGATVEIVFKIEKPGNYRLRAAVSDLAGRTAVVWNAITVEN